MLGDQVIRVLDPKVFLDVMSTGMSVRDEKVYLTEYKRYVEQSVIYDKSYHIVMCIMRDVTEEERERMSKEKISQQTIEMTDRVIEKQMRMAQEIASLLGETTAETKKMCIRDRDQAAREACGLSLGQELSPVQVGERLRQVNRSQWEKVCGGCRWQREGLCSWELFERLRKERFL